MSWEDWPAAAIYSPASGSGRTWYLGFWQQLAFYCALARQLCFTVRDSLPSLTGVPREVTGIKAMVSFTSPHYPTLELQCSSVNSFMNKKHGMKGGQTE